MRRWKLPPLTYAATPTLAMPTLSITFAGVPWHSSVDDAIALLQAKGFVVSKRDDGSLIAKGKIFGRNSGTILTFDSLGLYDVGVAIDIETSHISEEYNLIKGLLLEKYGTPESENERWTQWQSDEATGIAEVSISLPKSHGPLVILYKSPECRQAIEDELQQIIADLDESRSEALDLL